MTEYSDADVKALAERLDAFPAQAAAPAGTTVPIHPHSKEPWALQLLKRGVRFHPELAEEFPVSGNQPGMGMWNQVRWVSRAEYDATQTGAGTAPETTTDPQQDALAALLRLVDPNMAATIADLDADDAAEFKATLESQLPAAVAGLQQVRGLMGVPETAPDPVPEPDLVAYVKADGTTSMVTPKQAAAYEAKRKAKE